VTNWGGAFKKKRSEPWPRLNGNFWTDGWKGDTEKLKNCQEFFFCWGVLPSWGGGDLRGASNGSAESRKGKESTGGSSKNRIILLPP